MSVKNLIRPNSNQLDLQCNSLDVNELFVDELDTINIKCDTLTEHTPANGVICNNAFKCNNIDARTGSEIVMADDIRVARVLPKIGNSVQIAEIDVNVLDIQSGTHIRIERPVAYTLADEYGHYSLTYNGVFFGSGYVEPASFVTNNAGASPYVPTALNPFRLSINESGLYAFNIVCKNSDVIVTNDGYEMKITNNTTGDVIGDNSILVGNGTAIGAYSLHCGGFRDLAATDVIKFEMALSNGVSVAPKNFTAVLVVTRIK